MKNTKNLKITVAATLVATNMASLSQATFASELDEYSIVETEMLAVDENGPEIDLSTLSVDKKIVGGNETVTVSVEASDATGIMYGEITHIGDKSGYQSTMFSLNEVTGKYEAIITIAEIAANEKFTVQSLELKDFYNNTTRYITSEPSIWDQGIQADLSAADFEVVNPNADETGPEIDLSTLSIDKKIVGGNETVTVSVEASDASGISYGSIQYYGNKGSQKSESFYLNEHTGKYEAKFSIPEYAKNETYSLKIIDFNDNLGNSQIYYGDQYDFSNVTFEVNNANQDVIPPTVDLDSIKIEVSSSGVHLLVDATDEHSGISRLEAVYQSEYGKKTLSSARYSGHTLSVELPTNETILTQNYELQAIIVYDQNNNKTYINREEGNLSRGDYQHVQDEKLLSLALDELMYLDKNQNGIQEPGESGITSHRYSFGLSLQSLETHISYATNYEKGANLVQINNIPNGTYKLNSSSQYYQTTAEAIIVISSENGVQKVEIVKKKGVYQPGTTVEVLPNAIYLDENNNGIQEREESIYRELERITDRVNEDAYQKYIGLYLENEAGKRYEFALEAKGGDEDIYAIVFEPETLNRVFLPHGKYTIGTDLEGKVITTPTEFIIDDTNDSNLMYIIPSIGIGTKKPTNEMPVISGIEAVTIKAGDKFDSLMGVSATDTEDGDLTNQIIVEGNIDPQQVGTYTLTYRVTDSDGNTTTMKRVVTVKSNEKPTITGADDIEIETGTLFDPMEGVIATDVEDGTITDKVVVSGDVVDVTVPGTYQVIYTITDIDSNVTEVTRIITVVALPVGENDDVFTPEVDAEADNGFGPEGNVTPEVDAEADNGFGPEGNVTPEVDAEADNGFGPEGNVTPEVDAEADNGFGPEGDVTPEVDAEADNGFGPEGNVTPEVDAEADSGFGPEGNVTPEVDAEADNGLGPEGNVTPEVDAEADSGFGPEGNVTPEVDAEADSGFGPEGNVTPEVDSEADNGFGPEGNVTPEVDAEADNGFGPEGNVTPEVDAEADNGFGPEGNVTPEVDAEADNGFGPEGNVTPEVDAEADNGFGPEGNVTPEVDKIPGVGKPVISGAFDTIIHVGADFDVLAGVSATDQEDGNLTSKIIVTGNFDLTKPGTYHLTYTVTDSDGNTTIVKRTIKVKNNNYPLFNGIKNTTIFTGAEFNPLAGITATDAEDGQLTITVTGEVDTLKPGNYTLTYTVVDSDGNVVTATRIVTVKRGLAGNQVIGNEIINSGKTMIVLPNLAAEQLEQLQSGETRVELAEGTLEHTDSGLVVENGEYRYLLNGTTLSIERLQATTRRTYELAYQPIAKVDLVSGKVTNQAGKLVGTLKDVVITDSGLLVADFTAISGNQDFVPEGNTQPVLPETGELSQTTLIFNGMTAALIGAWLTLRRKK